MKKLIIVFLCICQLAYTQRVKEITLYSVDISGNDSTYFFEFDKLTSPACFIYFDKVQANTGEISFGYSMDGNYCSVANNLLNIFPYTLSKNDTAYRVIDNADTSFVMGIINTGNWSIKCKACIKWNPSGSTDTLTIRY